MVVAEKNQEAEIGLIPDGWEAKPLLSALRIAKGQVDPRVEPYKSMVLVAPDHIEGGTGRLLVKKTAGELQAISGKYLAAPDDIIYSKIRPYLRKAIVTSSACLCSADMYPMTPAPGISSQFMLAIILSEQFTKYAETVSLRSGMPKINREELAGFTFASPPTHEQRAIAKALGDVDALIESLERLIAKKRDIKQATMQQLLTGQTRLPGFTDAWTTKRIGDFTDCTTGGTPSTLVREFWGGPIRWMNSGELNMKRIFEVEGRISPEGLKSSSARLVPRRCVLIGLAGQGRTRGTVAINYVELCTNQSIAAIFPNNSFTAEYLYYNLDSRYDELRELSSGGGRGGLNLTLIRSLEIPWPSVEEQAAIAEVLADTDGEISGLLARVEKTRGLKLGMMQQLLIGKVRLVTRPKIRTESVSDTLFDPAPFTASLRQRNRTNEDAVITGYIAHRFSSSGRPIGNVRRTKLTYLFRRHTKTAHDGYIKKAAGPYDPSIRYGGAIEVALTNRLAKEVEGNHKGKYTGLIGDSESQTARELLDEWFGERARIWLDQFERTSTEELECLATVDLAILELRTKGEETTLASVKAFIRSEPEWAPKLKRSAFSDSKIVDAINLSVKLFGKETA